VSGGVITAKQRVLVIDDEIEMGELICATAEAMGFECTLTTDSKMFIKMLSPDTTIVLLDLILPEMDGVELLRMLGKQKCKAGIVLISAVGKRTIESATQLAQVHGLHIMGHLQKPFQLADLKEVLQRLPGPDAPPAVRQVPQLTIERWELESAIEHDEFIVYYQPQIDIPTGCVSGVEALTRWRHPERGLIFPDSFIGPMEKLGLIDKLGWIVANLGMSEVSRFVNCDGSAFTLSLNASVNSLCDLSFPDILASIAEKHGVSLGNVTIEIIETGLIKKLSRTLDILTRLRIKQVKLSIDDFGTGYAMMQQFKNIPATELKIDKSFIQEMISNDRNRIMVRKTIEMGHELGMRVVAEGVETQEQLELLHSMGCDTAQGYLFSRPLPTGEMVSWLKSYRAHPVHSVPTSGELFYSSE
jgi:EAL domain-containing protein (putative c-di-GMP-specific phosphodiesterase class I)/CheY-like chemotaxis protein